MGAPVGAVRLYGCGCEVGGSGYDAPRLCARADELERMMYAALENASSYADSDWRHFGTHWREDARAAAIEAEAEARALLTAHFEAQEALGRFRDVPDGEYYAEPEEAE